MGLGLGVPQLWVPRNGDPSLFVFSLLVMTCAQIQVQASKVSTPHTPLLCALSLPQTLQSNNTFFLSSKLTLMERIKTFVPFLPFSYGVV